MSLLVTGTVGVDTIHTPRGRAEGVLGGSCAYFAAAASLRGPDCEQANHAPLRAQAVAGRVRAEAAVAESQAVAIFFGDDEAGRVEVRLGENILVQRAGAGEGHAALAGDYLVPDLRELRRVRIAKGAVVNHRTTGSLMARFAVAGTPNR